MGGGQNTYKINPLFKDIKEYNKYLLSLIGIFVLLLSGIISYNYTNTSYAKWSSSVESKNVLKIYVKQGIDALEFVTEKVGINGLEEVVHTIDDTLQVDSKFATEYRYRGGDVANYVIFNNEIWRIIGIIPTEDTDGNVENRFKIIKDESIGYMYWNTTEDTTTGTYNNWVTGTLNTYLNNDYYNTLSTTAKNMIGTTKYYLGGYRTSEITKDAMWEFERKKENDDSATYYYKTNPIMQNEASKKIAIMYSSDYGYAASKECGRTLYRYDNKFCETEYNWLDKSEDTWLLSPTVGYNNAFHISSNMVYGGSVGAVNKLTYVTRPVLSLSSNVKISSGTGTSSDPYQLSL